MFNNAKRGKKCLYFTTLSEPAPKLIRYTQMFEFFDKDIMNEGFKFIDLGSALREGGPQKAMERITEIVEEEQPDIVAIDSFKAIHDLVGSPEISRTFVYDLAVHLSLWSVTTFLVGEYTLDQINESPEFAIADAIIYMGTETAELSSLREFQVRKLRGSDFNSGKHFFEISSDGIHVYPRVGTLKETGTIKYEGRIHSGVPGLDEMLHGGIPSSLQQSSREGQALEKPSSVSISWLTALRPVKRALYSPSRRPRTNSNRSLRDSASRSEETAV
jgi:circadian clock protein KaiC